VIAAIIRSIFAQTVTLTLRLRFSAALFTWVREATLLLTNSPLTAIIRQNLSPFSGLLYSHKTFGASLMNQTSFSCPQCRQMRLFQQKTMNHTPHILASVFLCGLWLPIWIIMALNDNEPWRCAFCGFTDRTEYLANPQLREIHSAQAAERQRQDQQRKLVRGQLAARRRAEREGSTFQERIAYFVSDFISENKQILTIAGVVMIAAAALIFALSFLPSPQPPNQPTSYKPTEPQATQSAAALTRKTFAQSTELQWNQKFPGYLITATGADNETLEISHPSVDPNFVQRFKGKQNVETRAEIKRLGFKQVMIKNSTKSWIVIP
jgi:hypothetical protein